jgi:hypothetical protein
MAKNLNGKQSEGFFNSGLLNFIIDEQKRNQMMNQSVVDSLTADSTMNEQFEEAMSSEDWFDTKTLDDPKTQVEQEKEVKRSKSILKARDTAWEEHKKKEKLTFKEEGITAKDGTLIKFKENAAKREWAKENFFTSATNFNWNLQDIEEQPKWLQKEIKEKSIYKSYVATPKYDNKGREVGYKNIKESPEFVRMSDGSIKKVHTGAHVFDGTDEDKVKAWQNRSMLFSNTWDAKSERFIKTNKDKAKDKEREEFSKFLFIDVNDNEAWRPYTEMKEELFFKPYRQIKDEYVDEYVAAREFQMEAERVKHKPAFLFRGLYYENPVYKQGKQFRKNVFGW